MVVLTALVEIPAYFTTIVVISICTFEVQSNPWWIKESICFICDHSLHPQQCNLTTPDLSATSETLKVLLFQPHLNAFSMRDLWDT